MYRDDRSQIRSRHPIPPVATPPTSVEPTRGAANTSCRPGSRKPRQAMKHQDTSSPTVLPTILRFGAAALSVAIAAGAAHFLSQAGVRLTPFLLAVGASVWYAGVGPGVLAIVLSVLTLDYLFVPPLYSLSKFGHPDLVYLVLCTLFALIVGWIAAARRRAEQELRRARDELDAKVLQRTADLQRSETYLAEAQRLSHTGSWAWNVAASEITHCSREIYC